MRLFTLIPLLFALLAQAANDVNSYPELVTPTAGTSWLLLQDTTQPYGSQTRKTDLYSVRVRASKTRYVDATYGNDSTATLGSPARAYATIPAAFAALQSGETLVIRPGTYTVSPVAADPALFLGASFGLTNKINVTVLAEPGAVINCTTYGTPCAIDSCSNVVFSGLTFVGPGMQGTNVYGAAVTLNNTNVNLTFRGNTFSNWYDHGVGTLYQRSVHDSLFEGNSFYNGGTSNNLTLIRDGAAMCVCGNGNRFVNNYITNWFRGIEIECVNYGIYTAENVVIANNTMRGMWGSGVILMPSNYTPSEFRDITITGNSYYGSLLCTEAGFTVLGGTRINITGNSVFYGKGGITLQTWYTDCRECIVADNIVAGSAVGPALEIASSGGAGLYSYNCQLSGNIVQSPGSGQYTLYAGGSNLVVNGNTVLPTWTGATDVNGFIIQATNSLVTANWLRAGSQGIRIYGVSNAVANNYVVVDSGGTPLVDNGTATRTNMALLNWPTGLYLDGTTTLAGPTITKTVAPGSTVIDLTGGPLSIMTNSADASITFSGTPAEGQGWSLLSYNQSATNVTLTIPSSFIVGTNTVGTTVTSVSNSAVFLNWKRQGSSNVLWVSGADWHSSYADWAGMGGGAVVSNLGGLMVAGQTTYANASLASTTNVVSGAITYAHCTNGVDGLDQTAVVWLFNNSGSDQTLTIPSGWRTNAFSPVPTKMTNAWITRMVLTVNGPTASSGTQTNVYVSFEYYH